MVVVDVAGMVLIVVEVVDEVVLVDDDVLVVVSGRDVGVVVVVSAVSPPHAANTREVAMTPAVINHCGRFERVPDAFIVDTLPNEPTARAAGALHRTQVAAIAVDR